MSPYRDLAHPNYAGLIRSITHAVRHADLGEIPEYKKHLTDAHAHAHLYREHLTSHGKHAELSEFDRDFGAIVTRLEEVSAIKAKLKKSEMPPGQGGNTKRPAFANKVKPDPGYASGSVPSDASVARREYNASGGLVRLSSMVTSPKGLPGRTYVPYKDLSPEDQVRAHTAFRGQDMDTHLYPVRKETDSKTGKESHVFEHGARIKHPEGKSSGYVPPAGVHREGTMIQIHSPDTPDIHGKKGVVRLPNPNMPGKVRVQTSQGEVYLHPHQIVGNIKATPLRRSEIALDDTVLFAKALALDIREQLGDI